MTSRINADRAGLSTEQLDLIEQFEADYNAVDQFLRNALGANKQVAFTQLVNEYSRKRAGWHDADLLRTIASVRNAIIHGKTEPYRYPAVPTRATAQSLRGCLDRLINPARAIPTFQRKVESVSVHDSLAHVLKIVQHRDYSQFPVYGDNQFRGLLTENGITRWLAEHVTRELSLVELEDVPVKQVLANEEKRKNYLFVPREMPVEDVRCLFASQELLEAVLITAHGKESEALLGIATRWDMIHLGR
jgi:predicted transcriptional regulator